MAVEQYAETVRNYAARAKESPVKLKELQDWNDELWAKIKAGESGAITSASANGVAATVVSGWTNMMQYNATRDALVMARMRITPTSRTYARII